MSDKMVVKIKINYGVGSTRIQMIEPVVKPPIYVRECGYILVAPNELIKYFDYEKNQGKKVTIEVYVPGKNYPILVKKEKLDDLILDLTWRGEWCKR